MATFRKYGGTNYSSFSNVVRHNILNSKHSSFNNSGLYNTKETFLSHIDMSGNSLLHVGNLFFQDGTSISTSTTVNPNLSQVLGYGNSAGNNIGIIDLSYVIFSDGTTLNTAVGLIPDLSYVLLNGNIASTSINMNNYPITNLGSITQTSGSNTLNDTEFEGNISTNDSGGTTNPALIIKNNSNIRMRHLTNLTSSGDYNGITKAGDNAIITTDKPLSIAYEGSGIASGIRIEVSNVRLQANATSYYDLSLSTGHNFYGNCHFNDNIEMSNSTSSANRQISTSYLNFYDVSSLSLLSPNSSQIYQNKKLLTFDNNSDTGGYYEPSYKFACNNFGASDLLDTKQTIPLSFNSSLFTIDVSNNSGSSVVKYQACNNIYYSPLPIGHNFYGNVFLNTSGSYLQFPDGTKQYSAAVAGSSIIYGAWLSNTSITVNLSVGSTISQDLSLGYIILPDPGNYLINYCNSIQIIKTSGTASSLRLDFISLIINNNDSNVFPAVSRVSCNNNPRNATYNVPIDLNYDLNASCVVNVSSTNTKYYLSLSMGYTLTGSSVPLTSYTGSSLDNNAFTGIRIS